MKEQFKWYFYDFAVEWDDAVYKIGAAVLYYLIPVCMTGAGALVFHALGLDMYVDWPAIFGCIIFGCILGVWLVILLGINAVLSKMWDKLLL